MSLSSQLNRLLYSSKHAFKQACERYDLVYFGHVDQHHDDHEMVRGFTLSPSHTDRHYSVGSVNGRDVILLERSTTISFPDKPSRSYTWTLLQIDLRRTDIPHLLLNANKYDDVLYSNLFTKFRHLRPAAPGVYATHDNDFTERFNVYGQMQALDSDSQILINSTTSVLAQHFARFDYECFGDHLIVCLPKLNSTIDDIESMLKAGLWLANELDSSSQ